MAKGSSASDSLPSTAHTVFIETNLNTRLATMISDEDTVLDFKQKIMHEHLHCFPDIGEIRVEALKVKRKSWFYHLVNSMIVKSVFSGTDKAWFLYVDAVPNEVMPMEKGPFLQLGAGNLPKRVAIIDETERNIIQPDVSSKGISVGVDSQLPQVGRSNGQNQLVPLDNQFGAGDKGRNFSTRLNLHMKSINDVHKKTSIDTNSRSDPENLEEHSLFSEGKEIAGAHGEHKKHVSKKRKEMCPDDDIVKETPELEPAATKKRTKDNNKFESANGNIVKEHDSGTFPGKRTSELESVVPKNLVEEALQLETIARKKPKKKKKKQSLSSPVEDPMKENDVGISLSGKETSELEKLFPEDPMKENDAGTSISRRQTSEEEVLIGNSFEDQVETLGVNLSNKPVEKPVNKKKTKKKKSASLLCEVSAALLSKETAVHETSKEPSVKNHIDFDKESDAIISPKETVLSENVTNFSVTSEKEKNGDQVEEVGQRSVPTAPSHDASRGVIVAETSVTEFDEVPHLAMEVDEDGGSKVESEKHISGKAVASGLRKPKKVKKGKAASGKVLTTPVEDSGKLIRDIIPSAHDAEISDGDDGSHDLTDKDKERKKTMPLNGDPLKQVSSEASTSKSVIQNEAEKNINYSNLFDTSDLTKAGDPSEKIKRKPIKSTKASGIKLVKGSEDVNLLRSESDKAFEIDHPEEETKIKEVVVSHIEKQTNIDDIVPSYKLLDVSRVIEAQDPSDKKKKLKKTKTSGAPVSVSTSGVVNSPSLGPDREADKGTAIETASPQTTKTTGAQETSDHINNKAKKKSVRARVSKPKSCPDPPKVGHEDIMASTNLKEEAPKKIKKSRSQKPGLVKESSSMVEAGKDIEAIEAGKDNGDIGSSQIPLDFLEGNVNRKPLENESNNHMESPVIDGDEGSFKRYFVPSPDHHEIVSPATEPGDNLVQDKTPDNKLKANKKMKKDRGPSVDNLANVKKSVSSNEDQGYKKKRQGATTDAIHGSLLKNKQSKPAPQPNGKASVNAGGGMVDQRGNAEAPPSKASEIKRVDASKSNTSVDVHLGHSFSRANAKPSKKGNNVAPVESSFNTQRLVHIGQKTKGYVEFDSRANHRPGDVRKSSRDQMGEVLNSSNRGNSLLATSNTIFEDTSSESTQDEGGISNSELSTRSPSGYSSSSELSKGESAGNGSYDGRIMEDDSRRADKSQTRNLPLDEILRSSRSYKKAKLTASQSQVEDTESQPIEFVLDSQF